MIKKVIDSRLPLVVYNPVLGFDIKYFEDVSSAGALPVFDSEFYSQDETLDILQDLSNGGFLFGLRLSIRDKKVIERLSEIYIPNLNLIVFHYFDAEDLREFRFDNSDYRFFIEVTDIDIDNLIDDISPAGVITKGLEAPGKNSANTSFVLMQWYLANSKYPLFVHGGVGWYTAAGLFAAGVCGVVLDNQLYLTDSAPVHSDYKKLIRELNENDSVETGGSLGQGYRFFAKLGTKIVKQLVERESQLSDSEDAGAIFYDEIKSKIVSIKSENQAPVQSLIYLGQDAVFARHFVSKSSDVRQIIPAFFKNIGEMLNLIDEYDPIHAESALAKEHNTKYPIVQGPMANVSDNAGFAKAIYNAGALPFIAMGSLPVAIIEPVLQNASETIPAFGAGLIGIETFNKTINSHLKLVKRHKAPVALFAGGIPSQVNELEAAGIKAYIHTPAEKMLKNSLSQGNRRFILEGTEAGGHVGSLTSLALWEMSIHQLLELSDEELKTKSLLFAGGIATKQGAWFISGVGSLLSAKGVKVGMQLGTPYLFSKEIVSTGAIKELYQNVLLKRKKTVVIGRTVGLASRTADSPLSKSMIRDEFRMIREKLPLSERKQLFEDKNIGSLLIGAKGYMPDFSTIKDDGTCDLIQYSDDEHFEKGNFLTGDTLAFFKDIESVDAIHNSLVAQKKGLYKNLNALEIISSSDNSINDEIAIIGMGCILPDAPNPDALWENIIANRYSIKEMPKDRFDASLYFSEDRKAMDKSYTKIAGVIDDFIFNGEKYGYTPEKAGKLSRSQQIILETAFQAMESTKYLDSKGVISPEIGDKTAVIIGTCLGNELGNDLHLKFYYPEIVSYLDKIESYTELESGEKEQFLSILRRGLEKGNHGYEPVHGTTLNIEASRIAHHMGITGVNYVVDAACATSFAAIDSGIKELLSGDYDMVITGGVNTNLAPEPFVGFSKMGALSAKGSFPFDSRSDGFVLGEGAGVVVMKRAKDAVRDGDNIIGIIKGLGAGSDGKGKAIAAPKQDGQAIALRRCFTNMKTPVSFEDIDYIEAHGTSTVIGDQVELATIVDVYKNKKPLGVSSIKSQIGHLLGGAGIAGVMKALKAIENKTLPGNGQFKELSSRHNLDNSSVYIIDENREWKMDGDKPRRAGVSSFGFGGINYHAVLEEFTASYRPVNREIFNDPSYDPNDDRIVVVGVGNVLPGVTDSNEFWNKLTSGQSTISPGIPKERFHNEYYSALEPDSPYYIPNVKAGIVNDFKFNNAKYRIPPKVAKSIDRAQLFALSAATEAISKAGLVPHLKNGNKTAVILGTIPGEQSVENVLRVRIPFVERIIDEIPDINENDKTVIKNSLVEKLRARYNVNNEDTTPGLLSNIVSGRVANYFNCNGPNFVVDASCASSMVAIDLAAKGLKTGEYDFAITGGVDTNLYPAALMAFKRLSLLSEGDCKPFHRDAKGYVLGEGAAIQVITTYKTAKEHDMPILAELSGISFQSSVPSHLLSPSGKAYNKVISACYDKSSVNKNSVDYLDVFGCSNILMDTIEKQSIEEFYEKPLYFGNIKPEFGYFKAANAAVAFSKLVLMNNKQTILPNFNYDPKGTIVKIDSVLKPNSKILRPKKKSGLTLASNVHGIGGDHGHLIVNSLPKWLTTNDELIVNSMDPFEIQNVRSNDNRGICALVTGQGSQYPGMMKELYDNDRDVKALLNRGDEIFRKNRGYSILDLMFGSDSAKLNMTENTQSAVFLASAGIYEYLKRRGLSFERFIGHSLGEYSSLYLNSAIDFETALNLIIKRSNLMKSVTENNSGSIMVLFNDSVKVAELISDSKVRNIYIANKNSNKQTAVAGEKAGIDKFCNYLSDKGIFYKKLALSGAFHTPLMKEAGSEMLKELEKIPFAKVDLSGIISNVTGKPYPNDEKRVKELLARQIYSPLLFVESIKTAEKLGITKFVEIGTGNILTNLVKNIDIVECELLTTDNRKNGLLPTIKTSLKLLQEEDIEASKSHEEQSSKKREQIVENSKSPKYEEPNSSKYNIGDNDDFESFCQVNETSLKDMMYKEYLKEKKAKASEAFERFGFTTEKIAVAGVSIGLPGSGYKVFNSDNFDKILGGMNFIEPLTANEKESIVDVNITRVVKDPDGHAHLYKIKDTKDVIQLAGKLGYFNIKDYGVKYDYDITISLAIAAGIEALKDAKIPLVREFKETSTGSLIPTGYCLPKEMQSTTGVILTSLFPGFDEFIKNITHQLHNKFSAKPYEEMENLYYHLMGVIKEKEVKESLTKWFFSIKEHKEKFGDYEFDRNLLLNLIPLGSAHFAQIIKAKGPNVQISGACASTTQAVGIAEDWIRAGRCDRVIIIGGEAATNENQNHWVGSGFLAMGAATIKPLVEEAAKPFDKDRNGTILGSGAVSLIIERESTIKRRGFNGQAEVLGTHLGNSAFHATKIDVSHLSEEMSTFFNKIEKRHNLNRNKIVESLLFISHETFTPARGGSASAEVSALKTTFPKDYRKISITNTKGYTGHTLGAALEDAVLVKALQMNTAPPIANLKNIPPEFSDLKLTRSSITQKYDYGLHLAAGFGSHFSFLFLKKINEISATGNNTYNNWLQSISGTKYPELKIVNNALCIDNGDSTAESAVKKAPEVINPIEVSTSIIDKVKEIISQQTGYSVDMLEGELDLEADLGIDTVKQVEIFAKISDHYGMKVPEDMKLATLNTIDKLSEYIGNSVTIDVYPVVESPGKNAEESVSSLNPGVIDKIKEIISDQTGYSVDMLEGELDLEADLGIDTVKQVEIFAKISDHYGMKVPEDMKLATLNTIDKLSEYIENSLGGEKENQGIGEPEKSDNKVVEEGNRKIERFVVKVVKEALPSGKNDILSSSKLLITTDNCGFSDVLIDKVCELGCKTVTLGKSGCDYNLKSFNPLIETGAELFQQILNENPDITGIIHLSPIDYYFNKGMNLNDINDSIKGFFRAVQVFLPALNKENSLIASLGFNSVLFPYSESSGQIHPTFAGISGMLKSINKELPETLVKMVDFAVDDPESNPSKIIDMFIGELISGSKRVESGYRNGERYVLSLKNSAAQKGRSVVSAEDVILVTGGARGITFEILKEIVSTYKTNLIILGRSDIEGIDPVYLRPGLTNEDIFQRVKEIMAGSKPLEIKREAEKIIRLVESSKNIDFLRGQGVKVNYHALDVCDEEAISRVIGNYSEISGVIHGAGVEESQFIAKKSLNSFNRVFDTKIMGAKNLIMGLKNHKIRFFSAFSSVTARFGNEGQVDYTAANDMLGKILQCEAVKNPDIQYKIIDWTAWKGAGMATNSTVKKVLTERGLVFLPLREGVSYFMDELFDSTEEVIISGRDYDFDPDGLLRKGDEVLSEGVIAPFIDSVISKTEKIAKFSRTLDLERDKFLLNHSKDGIPIFLGATGIETMAEVATQIVEKDLVLTKITDFSIPYGIKILKGRPKEILPESSLIDKRTCRCRILSNFKNRAGEIVGEPKLHYEGTYHFEESAHEEKRIEIPVFTPVTFDSELKFKELIYHPSRLFMNGVFDTLQGISSFNGRLLVTTISDISDDDFFNGVKQPEFMTNVVILDAMFQTGGVFEFISTDEMVLPYMIKEAHFRISPVRGKEYYCLTEKIASTEKTNVYNLQLVDKKGVVYMEIDGFQMVKVRKIEKKQSILKMVNR